MNNLDNGAKSYLVACLITGIDVVEDSKTLMSNLVEHLNSTERIFYAEGDEDGIIVHDKHDSPILSLLYNGQRLVFNAFGQDESHVTNGDTQIGYALLNVVGYLQEQGYEFGPSILGSQSIITNNLTDEDWSL